MQYYFLLSIYAKSHFEFLFESVLFLVLDLKKTFQQLKLYVLDHQNFKQKFCQYVPFLIM